MRLHTQVCRRPDKRVTPYLALRSSCIRVCNLCVCAACVIVEPVPYYTFTAKIYFDVERNVVAGIRMVVSPKTTRLQFLCTNGARGVRDTRDNSR